MHYVYVLQSINDADRHYTGVTTDLRDRIGRHNAGEVSYTSRHMPWRLETYVAFADQKKAIAFERYLKSASGRAFARKRF